MGDRGLSAFLNAQSCSQTRRNKSNAPRSTRSKAKANPKVMRGPFLLIAALCTGAPAIAQDAPTQPTDETRVENAANSFFAALRGKGNYELSELMRPDGLIMISDRMNPEKPNLVIVPNAAYLASRGDPFTELMDYQIIEARDGIGHIWGPYRVIIDGKTTHCGINSMGFIENEEGVWQLGNTSFTMVPPDQCDNLGAPKEPAE